jgi:hypothetical protein
MRLSLQAWGVLDKLSSKEGWGSKFKKRSL